MLEQAIVDAQALREAALKNAEQALIEKFAPQIKEAVESLLEGEVAEAKRIVSYEGKNYSLMEIEGDKATIKSESQKPFVVEASELGEELLQEVDMDLDADQDFEDEGRIEAPPAFTPDADLEKKVEYKVKDKEPVYEFDLNELMDQEELAKQEPDLPETAEEPAKEPAEEEGLDLGALQEGEDDLINEITKLLSEMGDEEEVLEEELHVDVSEQKHGYIVTDEGTRKFDEELRKAKMESDEMKEELEDEKKKNEDLKETIKRFKLKNKQYKDAVEKLSQKLNETLLSNAKLLYSNKTLSDASLNERQKNKIVEAIAKSRTPEEAKHLCETLNATVTSSTDNKSPRTLSESVQRKSNLSGILPRRKQVNESREHTFAEKMRKLAGIK
jgi:hypothetical protein